MPTRVGGVAICLTATLWVQAGTLSSMFKHDDYLHLYGALDPGIWSYAWQPMGGHVFPIPKLLFGLLFSTFGLEALPFALVQLGIHLLNVLLLFGIAFRLTRRPILAGVFAGLWGAAPIHVLPLGWFTCVQILLCLFFLLVILYDLAGYAARQEVPKAKSLIGWVLLSMGAMGSYALGNLIPVALPLVAYLVLPSESTRGRTALRLLPVVLLPLLYNRVLAAHGQSLDLSHFDLGAIVSVAANLFSYGIAGLLAAPLFTIDTTGATILPGWQRHFTTVVPWTMLISIPCALLFVPAFVRCSERTRPWLLACVLLLVGSYALIALGRAPMLPLVPEAYIATSARYHYLPSAMIALAMFFIAASFSESVLSPHRTKTGIAMFFILGLVMSVDRWAALRVDAGESAYLRRYTAELDRQLWTVVHSVPSGSHLYIHNEFISSGVLTRMGVKIAQFPHLAGYYAISVGDPLYAERRVHFIEPNTAYVARVRNAKGSLMAQILATPDEAHAARAPIVGSPRGAR